MTVLIWQYDCPHMTIWPSRQDGWCANWVNWVMIEPWSVENKCKYVSSSLHKAGRSELYSSKLPSINKFISIGNTITIVDMRALCCHGIKCFCTYLAEQKYCARTYSSDKFSTYIHCHAPAHRCLTCLIDWEVNGNYANDGSNPIE